MLLSLLLVASPCAFAAARTAACPSGQHVELNLAKWRKLLMRASGDIAKIKGLLAPLALQPLHLRTPPADLFEQLAKQNVNSVRLSSAKLVGGPAQTLIEIRLSVGRLHNIRLAALRPLGKNRYCRLSFADARFATDDSRLQVCAPKKPFSYTLRNVVSKSAQSIWMIRHEPNSSVDGTCNPTSSLDVLHAKGNSVARIFSFDEAARVKVTGKFPKVFRIREFDPDLMREREDTYAFNGRAYQLARK